MADGAQTLKGSWLEKKNSLGFWQRRHFLLTPGTLIYGKDDAATERRHRRLQDDEVKSTDAAYLIKVKEFRGAELVQKGKPGDFSLDFFERKFRLRAESADEALAWVTALKDWAGVVAVAPVAVATPAADAAADVESTAPAAAPAVPPIALSDAGTGVGAEAADGPETAREAGGQAAEAGLPEATKI